MHSKDFLIDDSGNRQAIEAVGECLPQLNVIPPLAFVVKPIDSVDRSTLMVSTKNKEVLGIFDLVRQEQTDRL